MMITGRSGYEGFHPGKRFFIVAAAIYRGSRLIWLFTAMRQDGLPPLLHGHFRVKAFVHQQILLGCRQWLAGETISDNTAAFSVPATATYGMGDVSLSLNMTVQRVFCSGGGGELSRRTVVANCRGELPRQVATASCRIVVNDTVKRLKSLLRGLFMKRMFVSSKPIGLKAGGSPGHTFNRNLRGRYAWHTTKPPPGGRRQEEGKPLWKKLLSCRQSW